MLSVLILAACGPDDADSGFPSDDIQIDAVEAKDVTIESPRLCRVAGQVSVAWSDDRDETSGVYLSSSTDDGATWFDTPTRVDEGYGQARHAALACTGSETTLAFEDTRDGEIDSPNIYARNSAGGSFADPSTRLGDDQWGWFESQAVELLAADDTHVYAVWQDARYGAYDILFARSGDGGSSWSDAVRLDTDTAGAAWSGNPTLAADSDGRVVVAWEDRRNGETDVYFVRSVDFGERWAEDHRVDVGDEPGSHASSAPRVALHGESVAVAWSDRRGGEQQDVYINLSDDLGDSWLEAPLRADSDDEGATDSVEPDIALVDGSIHIVWRDARIDPYDVYYRRADDGLFGEREVQLDVYTGDATHSFEPRVRVDAATVLVAWTDERHSLDGGNSDVFYSWSDDGGDHWADGNLRVNSLEGGVAWSHDLQLLLAEGSLYATWIDDRNGQDALWFTRLALGESATTPSGVP